LVDAVPTTEKLESFMDIFPYDLTRISHKLDEKVNIVNGSGNDGVKYLHQSDESMRITKIMAPQ
jgi:hypothetical protein